MQGLPLEVRVGLGYTLEKSDLLLCIVANANHSYFKLY